MSPVIETDRLILSPVAEGDYADLCALLADPGFFRHIFPQALTFGGHPVTAAAAVKNIEILESENMVQNSAETGAYFKEQLQGLMADHPVIGDVRGKGLMVGLELVVNREYREPANKSAMENVLATAYEQGVMIRVSGNNIIHRGSVNIGIAVDLDPGLIVPVMHDTDELSLVGIGKKIIDLADRARSRKLAPAEIQGATFSITNPGVLGTLVGMPIIPKGTAAILGTGAIEKRAVVVEDPLEKEVPRIPGLHCTQDPESGRRRMSYWSHENVQKYRHEMERRRQQLTQLFYRMNLDFLWIDAGEQEFVDRLVEFFIRRGRMS